MGAWPYKGETFGNERNVLVHKQWLVAAKALDHTQEHDDKLKYAGSMDLVQIEHVEEIVNVKVDLFHVLNKASRRSDLITVKHAG